ncbi:MAG TPA: MoaD/ThiS family protein [Rudaea sp.]|jgi:molybdopterin synthase sulfur carrier subunit|uniref:MoaD/ThiS family protein n=1 Tax=Rudaea sp. TaxID=2136325 RepID=UPI002F92CBDE
MNFRVLYFASLRDQAGCDAERVDSAAAEASVLYAELRARHGFSLAQDRLRVAINGDFALWDHPLSDGDEIVFLPPVSGG